MSFSDVSFVAPPPLGTFAPTFPIINPFGLRRWRASLADALNVDAPIVAVGDSHTFGQNANGNDTSLNTDKGPDAPLAWCGQLRSLFGVTYGFPGEGLWLPSATYDSRVTIGGGAVSFTNPGQAPALMRFNTRLTSTSQTITVTVPTGVTRMMVVQANQSGNVSSTWSLNGTGQGSISTLTGTGVPILTYLAVTAGQPVVITGPASGNDVFQGIGFRTATTNGVPVHCVGVGGQTQWNMQGGAFNGVTGTSDGSTFYSTAQQQANVSACYKWAGARGLVIMYFGTNEQALQLGSAGLNNGITPPIFQAGIQLAVNQIAADGWCTLLVGAPASASENQAANALPLTSFSSVMSQVASATDHVAFCNISDLWGGNTSAAKLATSNAGLRNAGDSHPTRAGYGDIARALHSVLGAYPLGN